MEFLVIKYLFIFVVKDIFIYLGGKSQKGICWLESEDEDEDDLVIVLEWDFLFVDYLIMINTFYLVRLIDTVFGIIITEFKLFSVVVNVYILVWIFGVSGMFVIGGQRLFV